ncbi:polysaccharide pyruvyl transferase family protein [Pseudomonas sp. TCU-HL1]|uniref:polysaccharide pyruvyl transferase family protein n=1 Tax=Pseudomonas sp. TCU-HL1 TaxID=1856685 RepID=UPI00083DFAF0|nr:polysaccharide pyruvyl transferase family protein [Pseudomonas sp. TCU-HL1]AOE83348.1 hypothetical protein THL1_800 [Pseudomonas sp. TCU-HL1]
MKKVYTLTFQKVLNNGAALQAYALAKFLKDSNFQVEVIDYLPSYFLIQRYRPALGLKKTANKIKKICSFNQFANKHLPLTPKTYFSKKSLSQISDAHAIVCGSDQVWNKHLTNGTIDESFLLSFAPSHTKRIAYAASAGSSRIIETKDSVALLRSFDALGVREDILTDDIKSLDPGLTSQVVVDPSLLIKDYSQIENPKRVPSDEYIVTYVVGSGETLNKFNEYIKILKEKIKLPVYHIGAKPIESADYNLLDVGPDEWISFIKSAKFVGTNSFHGTAFSVNFEKQFLFFPHTVENLNTRQTTLLKRINLLDRLVPTPFDLEKLKIESIDYSLTNPKLLKIVKESKDFLLNALS